MTVALDEYSFWLEPQGLADVYLDQCISRFARTLGAIPFAPHLTLIGGIRELAVAHDVAGLLNEARPCEVACVGFGSEDHFYKSLYITCDSPELMRLNERLQKALGRADEYKPHISLLYGNFSPEQKKPLVDALASRCVIGRTFYFRLCSLWHAKGSVDKWRRMQCYPLGQ